MARTHEPTPKKQSRSETSRPRPASSVDHVPTHNLGPVLLAVLGLLAAMGPLSTDLVLPAFTGIAEHLDTDPAAVQLTLTAFLIGIGSGPLLVGPLSDRFGRRTVLIIALALYAVSALFMAFAWHIAILIALRAVQGLGAAAAVVLSRAVAADLTTGTRAVRAVSIISVGVGIGALIAPTIGGALQTTFDWHAVFVASAVLGVVALLLVLFLVPETHPPSQRTAGSGPLAILQGMGMLLHRGDVRGYVVAIGSAYAAMTAFLVSSPFVGQQVLGLDPFTYGVLLTTAASSVSVASLANALLASRVDARILLYIGQTSTLTAGAALLVAALTGTLNVVVFVLGAFLLFAGTGLVMANTTALTLAVAGRSRGTASALCSTGQYAMGALAPIIVGLLGAGSPLPMAATVAGFGVIGVVALFLGRLGAPREAA